MIPFASDVRAWIATGRTDSFTSVESGAIVVVYASEVSSLASSNIR
ncbi:hypothetical protein ACVWW1_008546 [Bradyrhizobium sp. JR3.5]